MLSKKIASVLLLLVTAAVADTIPSGARLTVRLDSAINSRTAKTGQTFHGTLARSLVVNGKSIADAGTPVKGKVTHAKSSGRLHDPGDLTLRLTSVKINGEAVAIATTAYRAKGKSHTKGNVEKIGGGAAACSAVRMPNPTAQGSSDLRRMRAIALATSSIERVFVPVTPVTET